MDVSEFAFETLPSIVGLLLVGYVALLAYRMRADFFQVVRSWVLAAFVVSLLLLWVLELMKDALGDWALENHVAVDITFIIFWSWTSMFMVAMVTVHRLYNPVSQFWTWFAKNPVNAITVSGSVGLVLVIGAWVADIESPEQLKDNAWLLLLVLAYLISAVVANIAVPTVMVRKEQMPRLSAAANRALLIMSVAWFGIPVVEYSLDLVLEMTLGFEDYNPYAWLMAFLFAVLARSIREEHFTAIVVDAEVETTRQAGFRAFDIPRGVYLVHDDKADSAFALFSELVTLPLRPDAEIPGKEESALATLEFLIPKGLVVTREYPDKVREVHGLQVTPIIWLTESPGERRIAPTSLAVLTDTLIRFMEDNPNSIILIEGIEYIMTFNEFRKVLRSLDSLNETAWITKARLLVTVNPKAFDEKDLALLERDRTVVKGAPGIEELKRESKVPTSAG